MNRRNFVKRTAFAGTTLLLPNAIWRTSEAKAANAARSFIAVPDIKNIGYNADGLAFYFNKISFINQHNNIITLPRKYFISSDLHGYGTPTLLEKEKNVQLVFIPELYMGYKMNGYIVKLGGNGESEELPVFKHENQGWYAFWGKPYKGQPTLYHYDYNEFLLMRIHFEEEQWRNEKVMQMAPQDMQKEYKKQLNVVKAGELEQQFGYDFEVGKDSYYLFLKMLHDFKKKQRREAANAEEINNPRPLNLETRIIASVQCATANCNCSTANHNTALFTNKAHNANVRISVKKEKSQNIKGVGYNYCEIGIYNRSGEYVKLSNKWLMADGAINYEDPCLLCTDNDIYMLAVKYYNISDDGERLKGNNIAVIKMNDKGRRLNQGYGNGFVTFGIVEEDVYSATKVCGMAWLLFKGTEIVLSVYTETDQFKGQTNFSRTANGWELTGSRNISLHDYLPLYKTAERIVFSNKINDKTNAQKQVLETPGRYTNPFVIPFVDCEGKIEDVPGTLIEIPNMPAYKTQDGMGECKAFALAAIVQQYVNTVCRSDIPDPKNPPADWAISYFGMLIYTNRSIESEGTFQPNQEKGLGMRKIIEDLSNSGNRLILESCKSFDKMVDNFGRKDGSEKINQFLDYLKKMYNDNRGKTEAGIADNSECLSEINTSTGLNVKLDNLKKALSKDSYDKFLYTLFFDGCKREDFPCGFSPAPYPLDSMDVSSVDVKKQVIKGLRLGKPVLFSGLCVSFDEGNKCSESHAVVISGYKKVCEAGLINTCKEVFKIHNSWGKAWQDRNNDGWVDADIFVQNTSKVKKQDGTYRIGSGSVIWLDP